MVKQDEYEGYLLPTEGEVIAYMVCPLCKCRAMQQFWEWHDMPEDKLGCPNCGEEVLIGEWIEGVPEKLSVQKCLMCEGTGNAKAD